MAKLTSLETINASEVNSQDGLYLAHKVNDTYEDKRLNIEELTKIIIPAAPTTDGTYTLTCIVTNGVPTYSWT